MLQRTKINKRFLDLSNKACSEVNTKAKLLCFRWHLLCEQYLPVKYKDSVWRFNRQSKPHEPAQGWKLHISATILEACNLFEKVAPLLISENVQFKAPNSLDELSKINCGLQYGYHQIGKFITIYPASEKQSLKLAKTLHELTKEFFTISVPFDEQYLPESSVFYRYGAFSGIEGINENGEAFPAIRNQMGELVPDDRLKAVPEWIANPFPGSAEQSKKIFANTPLGTTYRIFSAITQRGKGGTYQATDFSQCKPRLCVVKEGRKNGELGWNKQDGYLLVQNEFKVLISLKRKYDAVPQVFGSFETYGNFYFAMEYVEGINLNELIKPRRRRLSIKQVLRFAAETARIIEEIHQAGWIWNDCKPANLILTNNKSLRPIDFESAYPIDDFDPFDWKTQGFSKSIESSNKTSGKSADFYSLGAVIYFLLTGTLYNRENPVALETLRGNVPRNLVKIIEELLSDVDLDISEIGREFERVLNMI